MVRSMAFMAVPCWVLQAELCCPLLADKGCMPLSHAGQTEPQTIDVSQEANTGLTSCYVCQQENMRIFTGVGVGSQPTKQTSLSTAKTAH